MNLITIQSKDEAIKKTLERRLETIVRDTNALADFVSDIINKNEYDVLKRLDLKGTLTFANTNTNVSFLWLGAVVDINREQYEQRLKDFYS